MNPADMWVKFKVAQTSVWSNRIVTWFRKPAMIQVPVIVHCWIDFIHTPVVMMSCSIAFVALCVRNKLWQGSHPEGFYSSYTSNHFAQKKKNKFHLLLHLILWNIHYQSHKKCPCYQFITAAVNSCSLTSLSFCPLMKLGQNKSQLVMLWQN